MLLEQYLHGQKVIGFVQLGMFRKEDIKIIMGRNVRRLRQDLKLTQDQLGELLDPAVDGSHIASMESGRGISDDLLARLCNALKVDLWQFFIEPKTPIVVDTKEKQALELFREATAVGVAEEVVRYEAFRIQEAKQGGSAQEELNAVNKRLRQKIDILAQLREKDKCKKGF